MTLRESILIELFFFFFHIVFLKKNFKNDNFLCRDTEPTFLSQKKKKKKSKKKVKKFINFLETS
jgi:hypothetical protein